jgi:hypothetical protein
VLAIDAFLAATQTSRRALLFKLANDVVHKVYSGRVNQKYSGTSEPHKKSNSFTAHFQVG